MIHATRARPPEKNKSADRSDITEARLLASVHERYTTVKRLVLRPGAGGAAPASPQRATTSSSRLDLAESSAPASAPTIPSPPSSTGPRASSSAVLIEIQFAGPQPSEGCGALLCHLLRGAAVKAWPLELPRGRKKKVARPDEMGAGIPRSTSSSGAFFYHVRELGSFQLPRTHAHKHILSTPMMFVWWQVIWTDAIESGDAAAGWCGPTRKQKRQPCVAKTRRL